MDRQSLTSSNIESVGYDESNLLLEVEFKSGSVYQFAGVSKQVFDEFVSSESAGKYFFKTIKGKYDSKQTSGPKGTLQTGVEIGRQVFRQDQTEQVPSEENRG